MACNALKCIVAIAFIAVTFEKSNVSGESGSCDGLRLDRHANDEFMTARKCISLFGTCCSTEPSLDQNKEDPRKMQSISQCYACYNSNINVRCTGKLVNIKDGLTAEICTELGGQCCDATSTGGSAFLARDFPINHGQKACNYCYRGNPQVSG